MSFVKHEYQDFPQIDTTNTKNEGLTDITFAQLMKSSIFITNATFSSKPLDEIIWRKKMLSSTLAHSQENLWIRSKSFDFLDPSEKGGISFYIGMAMAAAFAEQELGFKSLVHLDSVLDIWGKLPKNKFVYDKKGKRPDLVGYKILNPNINNQKLVCGFFEAKGRSNGFDKKVEEAAIKEQLGKTGADSGSRKILKVATQSFFSGSNKTLNFKLRDPVGADFLGGIGDHDLITAVEMVKAITLVNIIDNSDDSSWSGDKNYIIYINKELKIICSIELKLYNLIKQFLSTDNRDDRYEVYLKIKNNLSVGKDCLGVTFDDEINSEIATYELFDFRGVGEIVGYLNNYEYNPLLKDNFIEFIKRFNSLYSNNLRISVEKKTGFFQQSATPKWWSIMINGIRVGVVIFKESAVRLKVGFNPGNHAKNLQLVEYCKNNNICEFDKEVTDLNRREMIDIYFTGGRSEELDSMRIVELLDYIYKNKLR